MAADMNKRRAPPDDLVRELAALVRWYRHGQPIKGVPKYLHGIEADKALARADAHLEGREPQNYSAAQRRQDFLSGAQWAENLLPTFPRYIGLTHDAEAEALRRYPEPPKEDGR